MSGKFVYWRGLLPERFVEPMYGSDSTRIYTRRVVILLRVSCPYISSLYLGLLEAVCGLLVVLSRVETSLVSLSSSEGNCYSREGNCRGYT